MKMKIRMVIVMNAIQHQLLVTEHLPWARNLQPPYTKLRLRQGKYLAEVDKGTAPGFKIRSRQIPKLMLLTSKSQHQTADTNTFNAQSPAYKRLKVLYRQSSTWFILINATTISHYWFAECNVKKACTQFAVKWIFRCEKITKSTYH